MFAHTHMKVPRTFFVHLASLLEFQIFYPLEMVIEPMEVADSIKVVDKGMVLAPPPKPVKSADDILGQDALSAWRCVHNL